MTRNNLDNPVFLFTLLIIAITVNTISSIHFLLIMLSGVLFMGFYNCLKKKYLYSALFIVFTFLFIEVNSGLKPFSLTMLSLFLYIFIIPRIDNIMSYSPINSYIYIILFYIGLIIFWSISLGLSENIFSVLIINALIDLIFFGVFI
jgi:hypothetical protein